MTSKEHVKEAAQGAAAALGSQRAIAKTLNVRESTVSYWMKGEKCSLDKYFQLLEIVKRAKTPAATALALLTAATALTFGNWSDANASETPTASRTALAVVYYVKYCLAQLSRLLSGFAALPLRS